MARNRSNRGSGSARRGRDEPERSGPGEPSVGKPPGEQGSGKPEDKAAAAPSAPAGDATPAAPAPARAPESKPDSRTTDTPGARPVARQVPAPVNAHAANGKTVAAPISSAPASGAATSIAPTRPAPTSGAASAAPSGAPKPGGSVPSSAATGRPAPTGPAAGGPISGGASGGGASGGGASAGAGRPAAGAGGSGRAAPPAGAGGSNGTRRSFGAGLIGGVIGGAVVALLIAFWFQESDQVEALSAKVGQIESTLADATDSGPIDTLAGRIDALESASGGDLVARLDALEAQVQGQGATAQAPDPGPSTPDLTGRMAEIEAALAELPSSNPGLAQLEDRLAALEAAAPAAGQTGTGNQAGAGQAAGQAPDQADALQALQERLAALETRVPEPGQLQATSAQLQTATLKLQDAESRLSQLSGSVDQLSQKISADEQQGQALAGQIGALGERLTGAESKLETTTRNRDRAAALALILGQLEAAVDDARPYQTQVQALSAMADDAAVGQAVAKLEPGAASGVPSLDTLRQAFAPVANEIVHAARAPDGNNLIDRAADNLMRLVTVRPVGGDVRGDSVDARVARAEASLNGGDLAAAVAELEPLEGAPAEAAAGWLERAKARLGANQALGQLRTRATELLTQTH